MARFCTQCGRPLAEGEVCTCTQQAAQQYGGSQSNSAADQQYSQANQQYNAGQANYQANGMAGQASQQYNAGQAQYGQSQQYGANGAAQQYGNGAQYSANGQPNQQQYGPNGQPMMGGQYGPAQPQQPGQAVVKLSQFGRDLLATLKNPVKAIGEVAARNDYLYGILTIAIDAVVIFFVTLIIMARMNSSVSDLLEEISSYSYYLNISLPIAKLAFVTFFAVIAAYAAQAGALLGMTKLLSKETPMTFAQALTYLGGKAFYSAMVALLTCLFTLFSATLGLIVFMVGSTFAFLICAMSYYQSAAADGSKKVYVLLVVYIANLIIVYLAGRIFVDSILAVAGLSLRTLNTLMNSYF